MVLLEISADVLANKHFEFSQSKLAFINEIQKAPGYVNFTEKPGNSFHINVSWENQNSLDKFVQSEEFHCFKGALITLSDKNTILISKENQNLKISTQKP